MSKSPSRLSRQTNFLKILLSLIVLLKGQSILRVRNIQPCPRAVAFCSERTETVGDLSKTGNCLNQQAAKKDKLTVAPLPLCLRWSPQRPGWRLLLFPREGSGCVPHRVQLGGWRLFQTDYLLLSLLSSSREAAGEVQASPYWFFISAPALPSPLLPVLGVALFCLYC